MKNKEIYQAAKDYIDSIGKEKIEKYHEDELKSLYKSFSDDFYKTIKPFLKKDDVLKERINRVKKEKKTKELSHLDFAIQQAQKLIEIIQTTSSLSSFINSVDALKQQATDLRARDMYEIWLDWALLNRKGIYLATHIAKLTHSSSQSSSIDMRYYDSQTKTNSRYLITENNKKLALDQAYPDNKYSSIAKFYNLVVEGVFVGDVLRRDGVELLKHFTRSGNRAQRWDEGFRTSIREDKKQTYFLSKQVYFPVGQDKYHLLMPLVSSSLAHTLHLKFKEFFEDDNTLIRKQKDKNKYHKDLAITYPNRSSLNVTASNHSNSSTLNGKRGGRLTLLTCKPPQWTAQQKAFNQFNDLFNRSLSYQLQEEIKTLQRLLLIIKSKEIGMKKPDMHRAIVRAVNDIADGLFDELNMINLLSDEKGWTKESSLPIAQQLLLEPNRDDDIAIQEKLKKQWQANIANDFAYWLNEQLKHKKLKLTLIQQRLWQDIFSEKCRQYFAELEVSS